MLGFFISILWRAVIGSVYIQAFGLLLMSCRKETCMAFFVFPRPPQGEKVSPWGLRRENKIGGAHR